jgi:hypothetical protein
LLSCARMGEDARFVFLPLVTTKTYFPFFSISAKAWPPSARRPRQCPHLPPGFQPPPLPAPSTFLPVPCPSKLITRLITRMVRICACFVKLIISYIDYIHSNSMCGLFHAGICTEGRFCVQFR